MHELSIAMHIARTVMRVAEENQVTRVAQVTLSIGELADILPGYLKSCWPAAVHDTMLEDTELEIEMMKGMVRCSGCGKVYRFLEHSHECPFCHSKEKEILSGRETIIKNIVAM